jgi:hypothetical protein
MSLSKLIQALEIFRKYGDPAYPTHCSHDQLTICGINPDDVSDDDKKRLNDLGFLVSNEYGEYCFISFRYGSA